MDVSDARSTAEPEHADPEEARKRKVEGRV